MLPKKGDLTRLHNYRPLSIAAVGFRILGSAVAARLQRAANEVINESQTGFLAGRHSVTNVITLYLLLHAVATNCVDGPIWILNLDQQKAYDRVRHEWLIKCLEAYGFGPRFLTYIQSIYRHPSICHSTEGRLTEPIRLRCGILQGDPMSCLLYNFSLQPLLDYARHNHHTRTKLNWGDSHPMFVSSLAFADDVLLVVNNRRDLAKFLDVLDLYEMASNAKLNEEKSQAFMFACGVAGEDALSDDDIPFPVLGDSHSKVIQLGYPFCLNGSVPLTTIEQRLTSIQSKVNILASTKTTLLARARICNSFLLSKLWHTVRICPIPHNLQRRVNAVINPFLFLDRRNWIQHAYVVAPRHLGGLGVIDTAKMSIALIGQLAASLLQSTAPIGFQFRAAFQDFLWMEFKAMPAHFILCRGMPWLAMNSILTSQKSFLHRVVYSLAQLRLSIEPRWDDISVPELLSLPFHNDMFGYTWPAIHETNTQNWERNGMRVWGDLLWYNPNEKGKQEHPNSIVAAYPLVPPSPSGVKNNYVPSRGHPDTYKLFSGAAGRLLPKHWQGLWEHLHLTVAAKLLDISKFFAIHPDKSTSKNNPRPHDRPFVIDTVGLPFPWRLATLAGPPLAQYTVKNACAFLSTDQPILPDWNFELTSDHWHQVWEWHSQNSLLTSEALSDMFLFLYRRPWLAQKPRKSWRLDNYNNLNDDAYAPRQQLHRDRDAPDAPPEQVNDAYESEHVFGVASCMLCGDPKDSAPHGFVECKEVQSKVWGPITGTLRRLVNGRGVLLDTRSIVLGWPDLKMPLSFCAWLLLWRDLALHMLSRRRHAAIRDGLTNDHRPQLSLDNFNSEHAALVAKTITDAYYLCPQPKKPAFIKRWLERGVFLRVVDGIIAFHPMSPAATAQSSASAEASGSNATQPMTAPAPASGSGSR